ncbi:hypothetical protein MPL3365_140242 [Mesorhizobium plurifarium]|uniref:Uncharacterized protein n=1 Tax=Mesorhizobium plurifarium TaxID=69974 RepID=A0A090FXR7_MESPL|nr:hypothetical protein MPL3365_140242 [Mesorhizobium plurifarium]
MAPLPEVLPCALFEWPYLNDAVRDRAGVVRDFVDSVAPGQQLRSRWRPRPPCQGAFRAQPLVLFMGGIPDGLQRAIVSGPIAIQDS